MGVKVVSGSKSFTIKEKAFDVLKEIQENFPDEMFRLVSVEEKVLK